MWKKSFKAKVKNSKLQRSKYLHYNNKRVSKILSNGYTTSDKNGEVIATPIKINRETSSKTKLLFGTIKIIVVNLQIWSSPLIPNHKMLGVLSQKFTPIQIWMNWKTWSEEGLWESKNYIKKNSLYLFSVLWKNSPKTLSCANVCTYKYQWVWIIYLKEFYS